MTCELDIIPLTLGSKVIDGDPEEVDVEDLSDGSRADLGRCLGVDRFHPHASRELVDGDFIVLLGEKQ